MIKQIKEKDIIPREITLICGICKKKATHINCECDDCYIKGALYENEKGFELGRKQTLEEVEKIIDNLREFEAPLYNEEFTEVDGIDYHISKSELKAQIKKEMKGK